MELKAAKELAHIRSWLGRVDEIVRKSLRVGTMASSGARSSGLTLEA